MSVAKKYVCYLVHKETRKIDEGSIYAVFNNKEAAVKWCEEANEYEAFEDKEYSFEIVFIGDM